MRRAAQRPVIGVTGPDRGGLPAWVFTAWAIRRAGGRPLRITPSRGAPARPLDALVLGGGADVDPSRYGEAPPASPPAQPHEPWGRRLAGRLLAPLIYALRRLLSVKRPRVDLARDALELHLLREAVARDLPVLGICRGAQLINVCFGGSLHQDLAAYYVEAPGPWTVLPRKPIALVADSLLRGVLGGGCRVNSLHRQAVDRVGAPLRVVAREPSGVVQAIEHPGRRFLLGVQWHPEYLPQRPEQRRLFRALVRAATRA